jgi:hypothetical protein
MALFFASAECCVETSTVSMADRTILIVVLDRHLRLGVGPQPLLAPLLAIFRQEVDQLVGPHDRRRHEFRRLVACVAEHDALVAGALVLLILLVDAAD